VFEAAVSVYVTKDVFKLSLSLSLSKRKCFNASPPLTHFTHIIGLLDLFLPHILFHTL
jgi:hypothetical protein